MSEKWSLPVHVEIGIGALGLMFLAWGLERLTSGVSGMGVVFSLAAVVAGVSALISAVLAVRAHRRAARRPVA